MQGKGGGSGSEIVSHRVFLFLMHVDCELDYRLLPPRQKQTKNSVNNSFVQHILTVCQTLLALGTWQGMSQNAPKKHIERLMGQVSKVGLQAT